MTPTERTNAGQALVSHRIGQHFGDAANSVVHAATLLSYSLLVPDVAERVHHTFSDVLDTDTGRLAQLYAAARLLHRIDKGDHPDLAAPLRKHAKAL